VIVKQTWRWQFLSFESLAEGRPVQNWFDSLPDEDKWEITDLLDGLQKITDRRWPDEGKDRVFDALQGAGGISEIRFPNIKCVRNGKVKIITYRIYGFFGPYKQCYTFLHGAEKEAKNDKPGKATAKRRLDELQRWGLAAGLVSVHKFNVESNANSTTAEGPLRTN